MDLTLRNATLPCGQHCDIGVADGRIAALRPGLPPGARDIDVAGRLVSPGLVETHIHLDKACILDRCKGDGTLSAAIAEVSRLKADFTEEDVTARADRALRKCIPNGTMHMRTHVEVDPVIGLRGLAGVRAAAARWAHAIDIEICVFPQEGLLNNPGTEALMREALSSGAAQVVGAAPYVDSDPHGQIDRVFAMARDFDVDIDMHLDFAEDTSVLELEHVCRRTREYGWGGRVAIGHVSKLAYLPPPRLEAAIRTLAEAGVAVTVLPSTDLFLMGRGHDCAAPRGVAPAHRLRAAGITCSLSTNNILNPFTPYGDGSLLRMANLFANVAHIGDPQGLAECLAMVTEQSSRLMNLPRYGIAEGRPADLVVLDSPTPAMAVAEIAQPMFGFKNGRPTFRHALPEVF